MWITAVSANHAKYKPSHDLIIYRYTNSVWIYIYRIYFSDLLGIFFYVTEISIYFIYAIYFDSLHVPQVYPVFISCVHLYYLPFVGQHRDEQRI